MPESISLPLIIQSQPMSIPEKKLRKQYRYLPYDEQSFDKVESSNNSKPRTMARMSDRIKDGSECNSNANPIQLDQQDSRPIFPFDEPQLWASSCVRCEEKISNLGSMIGIPISHHPTIKSIIPLPPTGNRSTINYAIEYEDSRFEKFTSKALTKWHLRQMVSFLQRQVFEEVANE